MLCLLSGAVPMLSLYLPMPFRCSCLSSVMCVPLLTVFFLIVNRVGFPDAALALSCPDAAAAAAADLMLQLASNSATSSYYHLQLLHHLMVTYAAYKKNSNGLL